MEPVSEDQALCSVALKEKLDYFRERGRADPLFEKFKLQDRTLDGQRFTRNELSRWLSHTGVKSVYRFDISLPEASASSNTMHQMDEMSASLATRERTSLLIIIGALCKYAKLDHTKSAKAAKILQDEAAQLGVAIGETTIENHLKKVAEALGSRMK